MNVARSAAEVVAEHTTLELECIDRMYLNVYVPMLQSWAGTAHFFREIRGNPVPSSALMELITRGFVAAIERYAATAGVDLIQFERSERGRPASGAHSALRPRRADDQQVHRTTARRSRRDLLTEPPPGVR